MNGLSKIVEARSYINIFENLTVVVVKRLTRFTRDIEMGFKSCHLQTFLNSKIVRYLLDHKREGEKPQLLCRGEDGD